MRRLRLHHAAESQLGMLPAEDRQVLEAYARGVTAGFVEGGLGPLHNLAPRAAHVLEWDAVDSVAWAMYTAFLLAGNWRSEMDRLLLSRRLTPEEIQVLMPSAAPERSHATKVQESVVSAHFFDAADPLDQKETRGSNVWAVLGERSQSGAPLLANDPHLPLTVPSPWFLARISIQGDDPLRTQDVIGATSPGLPMVLLGRTRDVAWGLTRSPVNTQGFFLEDPRSLEPAGMPTVESVSGQVARVETIHVRGGSDVQVSIEDGKHGPIVGELRPAHAESGELSRTPISLQWNALQEFAGSISAAFAANRARNCTELLEAYKTHVAPAQNLVAADSAGQVCAEVIGAHDEMGRKPSPNAFGSRSIPSIAEVGMSVVANANQDWTLPGMSRLAGDWDRPFRYARILELLSLRPKHDVQSFASMQYDTVSLEAQKLLPALKQARAVDPLSLEALRILMEFDGNMRADSPAPLIYTAWLDEFTRSVIGERVGQTLFSEFYGRRHFRQAIEAILLDERTATQWCKSNRCQQELSKALARAVARVSAQQGSAPLLWRWGRAHRVSSIMPAVPGNQFHFGMGPEVGGDISTVQMTHFETVQSGAYPTLLAANVRFIYDLSDANSSWFVHFGGLDEGPSSRNAVAAEEWKNGLYRELRFEPRGWGQSLRFVSQ